mgnify:CR=1 FL=1
MFAKEPSLKPDSIFVSGKDLVGDSHSSGGSSGKSKLGASSMNMSVMEASIMSGMSSLQMDCGPLIEEEN